MQEILLNIVKRKLDFRASLWSMEKEETYGIYYFKDGDLKPINMATYSPAWLIEAECFIKNIIENTIHRGEIRQMIGWHRITIHVDLIKEKKPEDPLAPIISMQPYNS